MTLMKIHSSIVFRIKTNSDINQESYLFFFDAIAKWIILFGRVVHTHSELNWEVHSDIVKEKPHLFI